VADNLPAKEDHRLVSIARQHTKIAVIVRITATLECVRRPAEGDVVNGA
jgi:hypothetical protein